MTFFATEIKVILMMKNVCATILLVLMAAITSFGQRNKVYFDGAMLLKTPEPRIGVGVLAALNRTDMDFGLNGNSSQGGLQVNLVPLRFLHINLDYSMGNLEGGPLMVGNDAGTTYSIDFKNKFSQFSAIARFMPLRIFMWDQMDPWTEVFTYFYAGLGYGSMRSDVSGTYLQEREFGHQANYKGNAGVFIQEYGVDLPIARIGQKSKLFFNLSYRFHKTNSDLLDSYKPTVTSNQHNDVYSTYNAGLTFKFL